MMLPSRVLAVEAVLPVEDHVLRAFYLIKPYRLSADQPVVLRVGRFAVYAGSTATVIAKAPPD